MNNISCLSHLNEILARWEEILYHELGGVANLKVDFIGVDFIRSKKIEGDTVHTVIEGCIKEIVGAGIARDILYVTDETGIFLKLDIKGCVHLPAKARVIQDGVPPYVCLVANMILDRIIGLLGYEHAVMSQLNVDQKKRQCRCICSMYETLDKIGQVSDWTKLI